MKVVCDRPALLEAVNLVGAAVASRTPRQQLTCVRLTAGASGGAGELTLAGTDAEVSLRLVVPQVQVEAGGEALVPADKLRQIVSAEERDQTLTLRTEEHDLHIEGVDAHFTIRGLPPAEFPPIPRFEELLARARASFTHPAGSLSDLISRTLFATARETSRYAINGVLLKRDGKQLRMVATDGRRLALCTARTAADKAAGSVECIVPNKALSLLQRLIQDADEPVQVAVGETQVCFCLGPSPAEARATLVSNLVEGTFPPYEEVIPRDQDKKIVFDRDALSSAVRRAALLTNEESRGVRLAFRGKDRLLELASRAPEMGEARVTVELKSYEGEDIEIGFNPGFLTDALRVAPGEEVIFELKGQTSPGLMRSGSDFLYVVMPVSLA